MERTGFVGMVTRKAVKRNVAVCVAEPRRNLVDLKVFGRQFELPGRVVLLSVPFMWGSFGPAVRYLYSVEHAPSPAIFNAERVVLAAAVMFWSAYNSFKEEQTREGKKKNFTWVAAGFELGAYIFLSTITQVVGLRHVEASRAAFLNQLQTVFVPILAFATGMERKIPLRTCISSLVAVAGLSFLASDHTGAAPSLKGDLYELASAAFFSLYVLRVGYYAKIVSTPLLAGSKMFTQAAFACAYAAFYMSQSQVDVYFAPDGGVRDLIAWGCVVSWTGIMSSALSAWAQVVGQKMVSTTEAAIIFATQPVVASFMSWILLGEGLNFHNAVGGATILGAAVFASTSEKED